MSPPDWLLMIARVGPLVALAMLAFIVCGLIWFAVGFLGAWIRQKKEVK